MFWLIFVAPIFISVFFDKFLKFYFHLSFMLHIYYIHFIVGSRRWLANVLELLIMHRVLLVI